MTRKQQFEKLYQYYQANHRLPLKQENPTLAMMAEELKKGNGLSNYRDEEFAIYHKLRMNILLNEILEIVKKEHRGLRENDISELGISLKIFWLNIGHGKYVLSEEEQQICQKIRKYIFFNKSMINDIICYYNQYQEIPPVGTMNDMGEDIGKYYLDIIYHRVKVNIDYMQYLSQSVPFESYNQLKKNTMINRIIESKEERNNNEDMKRFLYDIQTGKKTLTEEQKQKLIAAGIKLEPKKVTPLSHPRRDKMSPENRLKNLQETYEYALKYHRLPELKPEDDESMYVNKMIRRMLIGTILLTSEEEKLVKKIHLALCSNNYPVKPTFMKNAEQYDEEIDTFVSYVEINHCFPKENHDLMNLISEFFYGRITPTLAQLQKLESVCPMDGRNLKQIEYDFFIEDILECIKRHPEIKDLETDTKKILAPDLYNFLLKLIHKQVVISQKGQQMLKQISINYPDELIYSNNKRIFKKNIILLKNIKVLEYQLQKEKQKLETMIEVEEELARKREKRKRK